MTRTEGWILGVLALYVVWVFGAGHPCESCIPGPCALGGGPAVCGVGCTCVARSPDDATGTCMSIGFRR